MALEETRPPYPRSASWAWGALAVAVLHFFVLFFVAVFVQVAPGLEDALARMDWLVLLPAVVSVLLLGVSVYVAKMEQGAGGFPWSWIHPVAFTLGVLAVAAHSMLESHAWRLEPLARAVWLVVAWIVVAGILYGFQTRRTGDYVVTMVNVLLAWLIGSFIWIVGFTLWLIVSGG